jgi:hypothetical protein
MVGVFLEGTTPISWKRDYVPNTMMPPLLHRARSIEQIFKHNSMQYWM